MTNDEPLRCGMLIRGSINLTRQEALQIQSILMKGHGNMHWEINSELFEFD